MAIEANSAFTRSPRLWLFRNLLCCRFNLLENWKALFARHRSGIMTLLRICRWLLLTVVLLRSTAPFAKELPKEEARIIQSIDGEAPKAISLLERLVNINSGTFNPAGVAEVANLLERELQALGFTTRRISMGAVNRGPQLIAERTASRGKRVLLLGHMDTVFEPSSPFQRFVRHGDTATGPGTSDMKGGLVVILSALKGLKGTGALDRARVTVFFTGDEESVAKPWEASRGELINAGKHCDAVLSFEPGVTKNGKDYATVARRGSTRWELRVKAKAGHSSVIFSPSLGDGAAFELSRVLNMFHDSLREPNMTYSVGMVLGGSNIKVEPGGEASVSGKENIVPGEALAIGDLRALSIEQLARVKEKMLSIVARSLPGTRSELAFHDKMPPMPPSSGSVALLTKLNDANRALGLPDMEALDPMERGAGDASFLAPYASVLDGLGAYGQGAHSPGESVDLARLPLQSKRAALLIYRLIASSGDADQ
jgi:glutamate carboxypeptidase